MIKPIVTAAQNAAQSLKNNIRKALTEDDFVVKDLSITCKGSRSGRMIFDPRLARVLAQDSPQSTIVDSTNRLLVLYNYLLLARLLVMLTNDNWMLDQWFFRPITFVTDPYLNTFRRLIPSWGKIELGPIASLLTINALFMGGSAYGATCHGMTNDASGRMRLAAESNRQRKAQKEMRRRIKDKMDNK